MRSLFPPELLGPEPRQHPLQPRRQPLGGTFLLVGWEVLSHSSFVIFESGFNFSGYRDRHVSWEGTPWRLARVPGTPFPRSCALPHTALHRGLPGPSGTVAKQTCQFSMATPRVTAHDPAPLPRRRQPLQLQVWFMLHDPLRQVHLAWLLLFSRLCPQFLNDF